MPKIIENLKEKLIAEATAQLRSAGYEATTVRSVAKACGVGVGTVYNYFPSKDQLIAACMLQSWQSCIASINKTAEKILELTGNGKKKKTALGEAGAAKMPTGDAMNEERKKRARELKISYAKLRKQVEAFNELEIEDCEEFNEIKSALEKLPGLAESETEFDEE